MLAGQQEVGRRLPTAEGRQRRAAGEAFSARRRRERGVKGAKKGQGGGQIGPGRRLGTWLKAVCALARQGAGSLGVSAAGRARAVGGGRVCSSFHSLPEFRMFTNSQQVTTKAWIKALQTGGLSLGKAAAMPSARPRVLEVKPTV